MSGSLAGNYFEDDTEDGKFTVLLFEDPLRKGELKMEVRLNGIGKLGEDRDLNGIALRPELDEELATRLADALTRWYAVPDEKE